MSAGSKFKELRKAKGLTLKQLAEKAGKTTVIISMIENDKTNPTPHTIFALAKALDCDYNLLYDMFKDQKEK